MIAEACGAAAVSCPHLHRPGDLVLDSCMGSGTTAVACVEEGRRYIGFETDVHMYELACGGSRKGACLPGFGVRLNSLVSRYGTGKTTNSKEI